MPWHAINNLAHLKWFFPKHRTKKTITYLNYFTYFQKLSCAIFLLFDLFRPFMSFYFFRDKSVWGEQLTHNYICVKYFPEVLSNSYFCCIFSRNFNLCPFFQFFPEIFSIHSNFRVWEIFWDFFSFWNQLIPISFLAPEQSSFFSRSEIFSRLLLCYLTTLRRMSKERRLSRPSKRSANTPRLSKEVLNLSKEGRSRLKKKVKLLPLEDQVSFFLSNYVFLIPGVLPRIHRQGWSSHCLEQPRWLSCSHRNDQYRPSPLPRGCHTHLQEGLLSNSTVWTARLLQFQSQTRLRSLFDPFLLENGRWNWSDRTRSSPTEPCPSPTLGDSIRERCSGLVVGQRRVWDGLSWLLLSSIPQQDRCGREDEPGKGWWEERWGGPDPVLERSEFDEM